MGFFPLLSSPDSKKRVSIPAIISAKKKTCHIGYCLQNVLQVLNTVSEVFQNVESWNFAIIHVMYDTIN